MFRPYFIPIWKPAPFVRLLLPFIVGIIMQWYWPFSVELIVLIVIAFTIAFFLFELLPLSLRFKLKIIQGLLLNMILFGTGAGLTWQQDIRRHSNWFGNFYRDSDYVIVKVDEAPIDKPKSFKATCVVEGIMRVDSFMPMEGKLLVYFSKDSASQQLRYGDRIIIHKNLQRIRNSGNPGAFDYEQYAAFQQLFHNVFLKNNDWIPLNKNDANVFGQFLINTREKIISVLKK